MADSVSGRIRDTFISFSHLPWFLFSYARASYRLLPTFSLFNTSLQSPPTLPTELPQCRYRLDNDTSAKIALADGRQLGYAQYGSPTGRPILFLHGIPGSRLDAASLDEVANKLGARIISPDRSGIGWSSPHPKGTVLSHAKDVEQLMQHLELHDYAVMGVSGGGPYALACAISMPSDKLKAVSIVCGLGPPDIGNSGMNLPNYLGFTVAHRYSCFKPLVRWYIKRDVMARLELTDEQRLKLVRQKFFASKPHEKDLEVFKDNIDHTRLFLRSSREAFAHGLEPFAQDARLLSTDFGFRVEDIRPDLVVHLWYGKFDTNVPANHGEQIAARLGGRAHLRVESETHASLQINYREEIMKDLIRSM